MKKRSEIAHSYLKLELEMAKETYFDSPQELTRRIQWIMTLAEDMLLEEKQREDLLLKFMSSILIAMSFLFAGFITYCTSIKEIPNFGAYICCWISISLAIIVQLVATLYKKRSSGSELWETAKVYLSPKTSFKNEYSENLGRILTIDSLVQSL